MEPLLLFSSVPLKYELSIERARYELSSENTKADYQRVPAQLNIKQTGAKMRQDSFEFRRSMGLKSVRTANADAATRGMQEANKATGEYASFGSQIMHIEKGATFADTAWSQYFQRATEGDLVFVPLSPIDISWSQGGAEINFTPAQMNINWSRPKSNMTFIPGNIEMQITQYPKLEITYTGGPVYVPPSADPNYEENA